MYLYVILFCCDIEKYRSEIQQHIALFQIEKRFLLLCLVHVVPVIFLFLFSVWLSPRWAQYSPDNHQRVILHVSCLVKVCAVYIYWPKNTTMLIFVVVYINESKPTLFLLSSTYGHKCWRHQYHEERHDDVIKFSALLAICAGNSQWPVTRSFDVFFDLPLNNGWVNKREAGDLRRHGAHYEVIVMARCSVLLFSNWINS